MFFHVLSCSFIVLVGGHSDYLVRENKAGNFALWDVSLSSVISGANI